VLLRVAKANATGIPWLDKLREDASVLRRSHYTPERMGPIHPPGRYFGELLGWKLKEVDGDWIRTHVDIDFVAGGNPGRYAYNPLDEIWVEKIFAGHDRVATIIHELVEASLMIINGFSYEDAHDVASYMEIGIRRHPVTLTSEVAKRIVDDAHDLAEPLLWKSPH